MRSERFEKPLFETGVSRRFEADPVVVYNIVSDLPRSGEWSIECGGGEWISGEPGAVGSVFRGDNFRAGDIVGWAPVVRGHWQTDAEVVAATKGREFSWAMRDSAGRAQDSRWSFTMESAGSGCVLTHSFRMGSPTEGIRKITAEMDESDRLKFVAEWTVKLAGDMAATLDRVAAVLAAAPNPAREREIR